MIQTLDALVNPFKGRQDFANPDEIQKSKPIPLDKKVERAYQKYNKLELEGLIGVNPRVYAKDTFTEIQNQGAEMLTPSQIELLLHKMINEAKLKRVEDRLTGFYLSYLIQLSYNLGHNNFNLTTGKTAIKSILYEIAGTKEKPLNVRVLGDVFECGIGSKYVDAQIDGMAGGYLGELSENSSFNVNGSVLSFCGMSAQFSNFVISGNTGIDLGIDSKKCKYTVEGKILSIGSFPPGPPKDCTFMTHSQATYDFLKQNVKGKTNKVILLK